MAKKDKITVQGTEIVLLSHKKEDYISLTDMAKYKNAEATGYVISRWLSARYTIDFMGIWERVNNPDFNIVEFNNIKSESGSTGYVLTTKQWIERTNAIGITARPGRYNSGTYAHKDIAFEFASWISAEFKFYLIQEFQRLKEEEQKAIGWSAKRELAKINYHIHTSAISRNLVPKELSKEQINFIYASEADVLNVALFGMTAKEWRDQNPDLTGNMRDYATINELICLSNMEMLCKREQSRTCSVYVECSQHSRQKNINAVLINDNMPQSERLQKLNAIAIQQMSVLQEVEGRKMLK